MEARIASILLPHPDADSPVRFIRSPIFWEESTDNFNVALRLQEEYTLRRSMAMRGAGS